MKGELAKQERSRIQNFLTIKKGSPGKPGLPSNIREGLISQKGAAHK